VKKILQYLIVLVAVLAAHLGIAAALIKSANTPEPNATADSPEPATATPVTAAPKPKKENSPPAAKKETEPAALAGKVPSLPVLEPKTSAGLPTPPKAEIPEKKTPAGISISTGQIGPPLPPEETPRKLPGIETPKIGPEDSSITANPVKVSGPPAETSTEAAPTGMDDAGVPAPDFSTAPQNANPEPVPTATPVEPAPKPVTETAPAPKSEIPGRTPEKKVFREINLNDLDAAREKVEEKIKKDLPSAVEAFAPENISKSDIDAVIREAHSNLRRRVNEMKASESTPAGSNSSGVPGSQAAPSPPPPANAPPNP